MAYEPNQAGLRLFKREYAEATRRTVFFVGAGCSREVGMPLWQELAQELLKEIRAATPPSSFAGQLLDKFHDLEALIEDGKYWEFFSIAERTWPVVYDDFLSDQFDQDRLNKLPIPAIYLRLWNMRNVRQILTLNLDGLITRAFHDVHGQSKKVLLEYTGFDAKDSHAYFQKNHFVVLNLHGKHSAQSTWVMNSQERGSLFSEFSEYSYQDFLSNIFRNFNVVFVGINPRDIALSPILETVVNSDLLSKHFWITPEPDSETFEWAQSMQLRVIHYTPEQSDIGASSHSGTICAMLDDVEQFVSHDQPVELPRVNEPICPSQLGTPEEFVQKLSADRSGAIEELSGAIEFLGNEHGFESRHLDAFVKNFDVPLQSAFTIGKMSGYNSPAGFTLIDEVSSSTSSSVWLVENTGHDGPYLALKSLTASAVKNSVERQSFRRGIESLYFLNESNEGVAPRYVTHLNVPMGVVMEYVSGNTLEELRNDNPDLIRSAWLDVALLICRAVLQCHQNDARVLHRDLKPRNIIFQDTFPGFSLDDLKEVQIRLINFDMSWHRFSTGDTKSISADEVGYYAPEQRNFYNVDAPRDAKTDVYMLGMILFYLVSLDPPPEGGSSLSDWPGIVRTCVRRPRQNTELVSNRLERLILSMTGRDITLRPDLRSVISELEAIEIAQMEDWGRVDPDLLVERLLVSLDRPYHWEQDALGGQLKTGRQTEIGLSFRQRGQQVVFFFRRERGEASKRRGFGQRMTEVLAQVTQSLRDNDWKTEGVGGIIKSVEASKQLSLVRKDLERSEAAIKFAVGRILSEQD